MPPKGLASTTGFRDDDVTTVRSHFRYTSFRNATPSAVLRTIDAACTSTSETGAEVADPPRTPKAHWSLLGRIGCSPSASGVHMPPLRREIGVVPNAAAHRHCPHSK